MNVRKAVSRGARIALGFALVCCLLAPASAGAAESKVVVLGFDGVDADLAAQWMDEGELPNLARLRDQGTFSPLLPTNPSQTPVSWSTFATGLHPGKHTVIDFLKRDPETYFPSLGIIEESRAPFLWGEKTPWIVAVSVALLLTLLFWLLLKLARVPAKVSWAVGLLLGVGAGIASHVAADRLLPKEVPTAINRQQGDTFWEILGREGKNVKVVRVPVTFPPEPFEGGHMLSGLPTPDLSKRLYKPFYFTSELFFTPAAGGDFAVEVVELIDNQGVIPTEIKGPPNELFPDGDDYIRIPMTLTVAEDKSSLGIEVSGNSLDMKPGEWSDWVSFSFPFNKVIKLHGIGRFRLLSLEPEVRLYLSPIMFDPHHLPPTLDISAPSQWAGDLADRFGLYKTVGWAVDTNSASDGTIDEAVFLEDAFRTAEEYRNMLVGLLDDDDWDMLVSYFEFTDRIQHVMFRHFDKEHPMYKGEESERWAGSILEAYKKMDAIVGETMEKMPEDAALFILSDHGFSSFRYSVNFNTWLAKEGYMVLEGEDPGRLNLEDLFDKGNFFSNVNWSKTKAYALGFGNIYINLEGRESKGIVKPGAEYEALVAEIKAGLEGYVHPESGVSPVPYVFTRDEAYGVYDPKYTPDLFATTIDGYRTGWQDTLGAVGKDVIEVNAKIWSGDHCGLYPELVQGILFSNRSLDTEGAYIGDLMPTLLDSFGVEPPEGLDSRSLLKAP